MKILFYPDYTQGISKEDHKGPARKVLEQLRNKYPMVFSLVENTFNSIEDGSTTLDQLTEQKRFLPLKGIPEPLYEFRIPPKGRSGVFRAYCAIIETKNEDGFMEKSICIYSAEIKKNYKAEADKSKIDDAQTRYNEQKERSK